MFHTASPYYLDPKDPQKELVDPALKGTRNVMGAVVKNKCAVQAHHAVLSSTWIPTCFKRRSTNSTAKHAGFSCKKH